MLEWAWTITVLVILDSMYVMLFRSSKKGKFKITKSSSESFSFQTDVGAVNVNKSAEVITCIMDGEKKTISFSKFTGLKFRQSETGAFLQELFIGLDITDAFEAYRDTTLWYSISFVDSEKHEIPIFVVGQTQQRDFLLTWYISIQTKILRKLGLLKDVAEHSRVVLKQTREAFRQIGIEVQLV